MNYLEEFIHRYFPTFAAFASLREIFRVSVAAVSRYDLRGEQNRLNSPPDSHKSRKTIKLRHGVPCRNLNRQDRSV